MVFPLPRIICIALAAWLLWPFASSAQTAEVWDENDTAIANHYIQSLQTAPEYGKVLNLLWEHYEKHDQIRLLLQYFDEAAKPEGALVPRLILGHLLRKKGNPEQAIAAYRGVLKEAPGNAYVLEALAQVMRQEKRHEEAVDYFAQFIAQLDTLHEKWAPAQLARAEIYRELKQSDKAVEVWLEILEKRSDDLKLRQQLVAYLLEEGRTEEAIQSYAILAKEGEMEVRMLAKKELGRLYEFIDDFDHAAETYEEALDDIHFKHYLYADFLERLVNLHERFSRIEELETAWLKAVQVSNPSEQHLMRITQFYRLTANPEEQEAWMRELVKRVPTNTDYRQQLTQLFIENDKYEDAAAMLEKLLEDGQSRPVSLVELQAKVALTLEGAAAAESLLGEYLDQTRLSKEALQELLKFSQDHFLDGTVERLLKDQLANGWGEEGQVPELRLASFHHERGRLNQVRELLSAYVKGAKSDEVRGERLLQVAQAFHEMNMLDEAEKAVAEAIALGQDNRAHHLILAETAVERFQVSEAVNHFQKVWSLSETIDERLEVDQRIFSVLRANTKENNQTWNDFRRLNSVRQSETNKLTPAKNEAESWANLWEFYDHLKREIHFDRSPEMRFRLAWWAIQIQDYSEAYKQLPPLHNPDQPNLAYEELLMELAEQTKNQALVLRQLELIAKVNPDRLEEFLIRKAQTRLNMGYEDEAIRMLRNLVNSPESTLQSVQALAKAYLQQDRKQALVDLWSNAFADANLLEKRQIVKPYSEGLIKLGRVEEALEIYSKLIVSESDLAQRRKLFEDQLGHASRHFLMETWMLSHFESLSHQHPLDRFYPEALSQIHLSLGNLEQALSALKRAYYMSNGDPELLEQLGELSSKSSDLKSAIYYQRKLIAADQDLSSPDDWLSLIERLEKDLRIAEADLTRGRLESKFGQDPDFLEQMVTYHVSTGNLDAARRMLEKITSLQPWNSDAWLELGLLSLEQGARQSAMEAFENLLAQTSEADHSQPRELTKYPFVPARAERPQPGRSVKLGLESYANGIDRFASIVYQDLDPLSDWMRQAKPEFQRSPAHPEDQRLRAIEELAKLNAGRPAWIQRWTASSNSNLQEQLWALYHAGAQAETQTLLEEHLLPLSEEAPNEPHALLYTLLSLRNGQVDAIKRWADGDGSRKNMLLLGICLLLQDETFDFADPDLDEALSQISIGTEGIEELRDAKKLVTSIRSEGGLSSTVQFGESIARTQEVTNYQYYAFLAQLSNELGHHESKQRWVDRAVENLSLKRGVAYSSFYLTVRDAYRMQLTAEDQQRLLSGIQAEIDAMPAWLQSDRIEAKMWTALATDQPQLAIHWLRKLVTQTEEARKRYVGQHDENQDSIRGINQWTIFEQLLSTIGHWMPSREELAPLAQSIFDSNLDTSRSVAEAAQFKEFQVRRLLWNLEAVNQPERERLIREHLVDTPTYEAHSELARKLEMHGFAPEALPIYRDLVVHNSDEDSNIRAYLNACQQARSYEEAIALLEDLLGGKRPVPESFSRDLLHHYHAKFLYLAGKVDRLTSISQIRQLPFAQSDAKENRHQRHYQLALIEHYRRVGDLEGAIRVYQSYQQFGPLSRQQRLSLAQLHLESGSHDQALTILEDLELSAQGSGSRVAEVEMLAELYTQEPTRNADQLVQLAQKSLSSRQSSQLVPFLARQLVEVDRAKVADGILTLQARAETIASLRFQLRLQQAQLRFEQAAIDPDPEQLALLIQSWTGGMPAAVELADLAISSAESHAASWSQALAQTLAVPRLEYLSRLLALIVEPGENPEAKAERLASEMVGAGLRVDSNELLTAAQLLLQSGHAAQALSVLTQLEARRDRHPMEYCELALPIFQAAEREDLIIEWHGKALEYVQPPTRYTQIAEAFGTIDRPELAGSLYKRHFRSIKTLTKNHTHFLTRYVHFLVQQGQYHEAEWVLMSLFHKPIGGDPALFADLYGAWGKLDDIESQLRKFYLNETVTSEAIARCKAYPEHRPKGEDDSRNTTQGGFGSRIAPFSPRMITR